MKEWLTFATKYGIVIVEALGLVIIVFGTIEGLRK